MVPHLISIPKGSFMMGENPDDKFANDTERPRHEAKLDAFRLGETPVTVAAFRHFRPGHDAGADETWPVANVSWDLAMEYCEWLGDLAGFEIRLPSETEWEYAARAGVESPFPWGNTIDPSHANYLFTEQGERIGPGRRTPVRSYPANDFGLYDMLGNVCEWVSDPWTPTYAAQPAPQDSRRVIRGGAWDYLPRLLRPAWRDRLPQATSRDNVGFRVAAAISGQ